MILYAVAVWWIYNPISWYLPLTYYIILYMYICLYYIIMCSELYRSVCHSVHVFNSAATALEALIESNLCIATDETCARKPRKSNFVYTLYTSPCPRHLPHPQVPKRERSVDVRVWDRVCVCQGECVRIRVGYIILLLTRRRWKVE